MLLTVGFQPDSESLRVGANKRAETFVSALYAVSSAALPPTLRIVLCNKATALPAEVW
jgi:hypothetical protein